jgi:hypothetical protein
VAKNKSKKRGKKVFRYRDSLTGRIVSKAKYFRSRSQGGKRYVKSGFFVAKSEPKKRKQARTPAISRRHKAKKKTRVKRRPTPRVLLIHWILRLTYARQKDRRLLKVEIHFKAPENITKEIAVDAVTDWIETGRFPKGWKKPVLIHWGNKQYPISEIGETLLLILNSSKAEFRLDRSTI